MTIGCLLVSSLDKKISCRDIVGILSDGSCLFSQFQNFYCMKTLAQMDEEKNKIRILNDLSLEIRNEDHTLLNPLRWCISNNWVGDRVEFCGYAIPHPSERVAHLTIQFERKEVQSPRNVLKKTYEGLECLELVASSILEKIDRL